MSEVQAPAFSEDLTKAIQAATEPDAIRAALVAEAQKQQTDAAEQAAAKLAADKAAADADAAKTPTGFTRIEVIGGKEFTFEAESELELERMVNNAYKVADAVKQEPVAEPVVDPAQVAANQAAAERAAADAAAARAELELKFKRGEISTTDYLEQSGAVKEYLEKQGVPLDELKASIEQNRTRTFEQSWESASTQFIEQHPDWPGGPKNLKIIGLEVAALGLTEAKDKVAALNQAYESMKASGMLFPPESTTDAPAAPAAPAATAPAAPAAPAAVPAVPAAAPRVASTSSSLFGRSSGVPASSAAAPAAAAPKIDIPANATPAEILEAWKTEMVKQGKDPNAAFTEQFSSRRA